MLEKLLKSRAAARVLGEVFSEDGLHLREVARRAGISPSEAKRELDNLVALGVLERKKTGSVVAFSLNTACPFLQELKGLYQKTDGVFRALAQALAATEGVKYAFVFGSSAAGRERKASDVDLLVVGGVEEEALAGKVFEVQKKTGKEINFVLWSERDLREKARKKSGFLKSVFSGEKVWLAGDGNEFGGIVEKGLG